MDSSLVMQLKQAFLHSQMPKQQNPTPDITQLQSDSLEGGVYGQLGQDMAHSDFGFGLSRLEDELFQEEMRKENLNSSSFQLEDDLDIAVDPVLNYISDMLMDEDMEDRRCNLIDNSAYRAMADELAELLADSSASTPDPQLSNEELLWSKMASPSVSGLNKADAVDPCESLYDEILRDPMTKEVADFIESVSASEAFDEDPETENSFSTAADKVSLMEKDRSSWPKGNASSCSDRDQPLRENVFFEQRRLPDAWIKQPQTESVENYANATPVRKELTVACTPEIKKAPSSSSSSFSPFSWKAMSLPSSTSSPYDRHGSGLPVPAKTHSPTGREDLFKKLQRSVTSHVCKDKQRDGTEGMNYPSLGGGPRLLETTSPKDGAGSQPYRFQNLQRSDSGGFLPPTLGLNAGRPSQQTLGWDDSTGECSSKKSSPSRHIRSWSAVRDPLMQNEEQETLQKADKSSDLIKVLITCAEALAKNDIAQANEILREIRKEASASGNGKQRVVYYFMEALVARISGTGGRLYPSISSHRFSEAEIVRAHQLLIDKSPFIKILHFFSNQTILHACQGHGCLHVVDYGIQYGFQWPSLIQMLANRAGGPPRLRITGIDFPQPGMVRPSERAEETGRHLSELAQSYGVIFEYRALVVAKWEDVQPSSLHLRHDEVLVVNAMFSLRHLLDETVMAESQRDKVLGRIRSMQPKVFVEAEVNAGYNAPFSFMLRFQEALAHFDNIFDAIDASTGRDHPDRRVLEQEVLGREIVNVVSCEGLDRVERAEPYKHWQWRTQRAGFEMLPLERNICSNSQMLMQQYHEDYDLAEDGGWLLVGWKGRFSRCISAWRLALSS